RLMGYLEQILELRRDARTRSALERLYERHGKKSQLIGILQSQLGELDVASAQAQRIRIAQLQLDVGDGEAAYETIEKVLASEPDRADAFEMLEKILRVASHDGAASGPKPQPSEEAPAPSARDRAAALLEQRYRAEDRPGDLLRVLENQ